MRCDVCGKEAEQINDAIIEGAMISVCGICAGFGKIVTIKPLKVVQKSVSRPMLEETIEVIAQDYSSRIKKGRESKGLSQENLAKSIAEKESVLHGVESGHNQPSLKLARKLQAFLGITIIEKHTEKSELPKKNLDFKDSGLTIGDIMKTRTR